MSQSSLDLANAALTKLGASTITILTEGTKGARMCNARYQACVDLVTRMHPWDCAVERVTLAPRTDLTPDSDYSYYSPLPSDSLRVLQVGTVNYPIDDYEIEGRNIASNQTTLPIKYIKQLTDLTICDPLLFDAFACYLAMDIAYAMTQDHEMRKEMSSLFQEAIKEAKGANAKEGPPLEVGANDLLMSRISGSTRDGTVTR